MLALATQLQPQTERSASGKVQLAEISYVQIIHHQNPILNVKFTYKDVGLQVQVV